MTESSNLLIFSLIALSSCYVNCSSIQIMKIFSMFSSSELQLDVLIDDTLQVNFHVLCELGGQGNSSQMIPSCLHVICSKDVTPLTESTWSSQKTVKLQLTLLSSGRKVLMTMPRCLDYRSVLQSGHASTITPFFFKLI